MSAVIDPNKTVQVIEKDPADLLGPKADIRKMMTTQPPSLDFVFPGLLKGTVGILFGQGAIGKTFLLLQAGVMITAGVGMLGLEAPRKTGRVVHISREDPEAIIHHRVHAITEHIAKEEDAARVAENLIIRVGIGLRLDILSKAGRGALEAACDGSRLCIIDTLARSHTAKENDNGEMIRVLEVFESLAEKTGCAILLAHHISKAGRESEGPVSGRGAASIGDNARWGASLTSMSIKQSMEMCDCDGPSGPGQPIGDCRGLYAMLDLGAKPNYAPSSAGKWLRREKGGVLVPAALAPYEKPEKPVKGAGGVGGVRRGLSNLIGPGSDRFDEREANQYAEASGRGASAPRPGEKSVVVEEVPSWVK